MEITTSITLDLATPSFPPQVSAVQYDSDTRYIAITITDNGSPWTIPTGVIGIVNIEKPDGTVCFYEYDADNNPAVTFDGNVATCLLVPQTLTVPGEAYCDLSLYNADSQKITTFYFRLAIQPAAVPDNTITSTNYYNILTQEIAAALGAAQAVIDLTVTAETLEPSEPASVTKTTSGTVINLEFGIPQGAQGEQGPQGIPGKGLSIMGTYASLEALQAAVTEPNQGDMYNVGASEPYTVYMWDTTTEPGSWISQGQIRGPQGPQGTQGETGATGPQGETGSAATIEVGTVTTGDPGTDATVTNSGTANAAIFNFTIPRGEQGIQGPKGETGATGAQGPQGEPGAVFTPAVSAEGVLSWTNDGNLQNPDPVNIKGPQGEQGETGPTGPQGIEGPQGPKGDTGTGLDIKGTYDTLEALQAAVTQPAQGDMYNVGTSDPYTVYMWDTTTEPGQWLSQGQLQGAQGPAGPQGPQGPEGPKGEQGIQGEQGPQGDPGPKGDTGPQGPAGPYFIPAVSQDGDLSWTNTGSLDNPSTVNIKGPQGEQGIQGPTGPEGPQGPTGPAGADGATGAQGPAGTTFTPSVSSAGEISWTNDGGLANPDPVNIKGPQGPEGQTGPAGPNEVTTSTATTITGILKGTGAAIAQAVSGTDYAPPSQSNTATLTSTGWADNAQTLTVSGVTATSNGLLRIAQTATTEQFTAWGAALPRITAQAADSITVTIAGTVPTVDIPVEVIIL